MKTNHTPGPWEAIPAKDRDGDTTISIRGNAEFIATMDTVSIGGGAFTLPEGGEANAQLIAAAPDLLAALETLLDAADGLFGADWPEKNIARDIAREAINKAKGGDNG